MWLALLWEGNQGLHEKKKNNEAKYIWWANSVATLCIAVIKVS